MSQDISSDWTLSEKWGEYGESEIGSIAVSPDASGTDIEIKGITLRGRFYDTQRGASSKQTRITLENIVIEHEETLRRQPLRVLLHRLRPYVLQSQQRAGRKQHGYWRYAKHTREKVMCGTEFTRAETDCSNEYLPSGFTIDGLYATLKNHR